jgi:hypothetical protein
MLIETGSSSQQMEGDTTSHPFSGHSLSFGKDGRRIGAASSCFLVSVAGNISAALNAIAGMLLYQVN